MAGENPFATLQNLLAGDAAKAIAELSRLNALLRGYGEIPPPEFWTTGWMYMAADDQIIVPHGLSGLPNLVNVWLAGSAAAWQIHPGILCPHWHDFGGSEYGVHVWVTYDPDDEEERNVGVRAGDYVAWYDPSYPDGGLDAAAWQTTGFVKVDLWR